MSVRQVWVAQHPKASGCHREFDTFEAAKAQSDKWELESRWSEFAEHVAPEEDGEAYRAVVRAFLFSLLESRDAKWYGRAAALRTALEQSRQEYVKRNP